MAANARTYAVLIRFTEAENRLIALAARTVNYSRARLTRWAVLQSAKQIFDEKGNWPSNAVVLMPQLVPSRTATGRLADLLAPDNGPVDEVADEDQEEGPAQRRMNPGRAAQARARRTNRANRQRAEDEHRNEEP